MSDSKWCRVQSKTHFGHYYYFNSKTGESTWSKPADYKDTSRDNAPVTSNVIYYGSNAGGVMELGLPCLVDEGASKSAEVEMEERWAEDEELMMDVDMTTELQQEVYQQVVGTRNSLITSQEVPTLSAAVTYSETVNYSDFLYLVIDTNILLSHLQFLVELKDCAIKGVGKPVLVIPWMVMQELDFLKTATSSVAMKAYKAIQFLHACFSGQHPRVRGQTMKEVNTEVANVAIHNNDDKILHCCLVYQSFITVSGGIVVLFSNDTQLCSKAIVNGIKAFNSKTLLSELRLLCRQVAQQRGGTIVSYTHTQEYAHKVEQQMRIENNKALLDDLSCEAESLLREGLSAVVQEEMSKAFGSDLWLEVVAIKPPWTFKDIVQLLDKHWIAVFGMVVGRNLKESVTHLSQYVKKKNSMMSLAQQTSTLIEHGYKLLQAFSINDKYGGAVVHSMAAVNVLYDKLKEACQQTSLPAISEGSPSHIEQSAEEQLKQLATSPPTSLLEQVPWVLGVVYESVKLLGSMLISTLQTAPTQEALAYLTQLHSMLFSIITNIQGLISTCPTPPIYMINNTITSLSVFLNVVLQVNNPVQPDALITYCHSNNILILQRALTEFDSLLTLLQPYAAAVNN